MKDYYVILTGSKNNAGDFLIKHRAKKLFSALRPDREIIDLDGWKPLDGRTLELVNNAKALILMGGPALRSRMYPDVYALTKNLDEIKVPITTMGIGWKSIRGDWQDTYNYPLCSATWDLLKRAEASGLPLSVRDFHTLNVLRFRGLGNILMTGCPAYYDLDSVGRSIEAQKEPRKVAFSLGVSFIESRSMKQAMKSQILFFKDYFRESDFEVVFHHSLDPDKYLTTHRAKRDHNLKHNQFAAWLRNNGIAFVDISGSAESLIEYYERVDLHLGYRVHAHVFMNSIARQSLLIAEDGRGKAVESVIGGKVIEGFTSYGSSIKDKVLKRLLPFYDRYTANTDVFSDVIAQLEYEQYSSGHRMIASRKLIDTNLEVMKAYLAALP